MPEFEPLSTQYLQFTPDGIREDYILDDTLNWNLRVLPFTLSHWKKPTLFKRIFSIVLQKMLHHPAEVYFFEIPFNYADPEAAQTFIREVVAVKFSEVNDWVNTFLRPSSSQYNKELFEDIASAATTYFFCWHENPDRGNKKIINWKNVRQSYGHYRATGNNPSDPTFKAMVTMLHIATLEEFIQQHAPPTLFTPSDPLKIH